MAEDIDIVVTWVDMNDPNWKAEFNRYSDNSKNEENGVVDARFRDYGLLKYWFRGIEKFAPWVRKIHFVTSGQKPDWLNVANQKLHLVNHREFIPEEFLPTYNSVVIERFFHKIPGLSNKFVYFNDDFYMLRPIPIERFFQNGLPADIAVFQYNPSWSQWYKTLKNNIRLINKHFDKKKVMCQWQDKWFTPEFKGKDKMNHLLKWYPKFITLKVHHNAQPYLKSTFEAVWEAEGEELVRTSSNRFRSSTDYSPELFRTWQICEGNFIPYNTYKDTKMFPLMVKPKQAIKAIRNQEYSLVCLNDNKNIRNYDNLMQEIKEAFESILPEKSTFEK